MRTLRKLKRSKINSINKIRSFRIRKARIMNLLMLIMLKRMKFNSLELWLQIWREKLRKLKLLQKNQLNIRKIAKKKTEKLKL